jgi:iron complex transport system ATP-binding protein
MKTIAISAHSVWARLGKSTILQDISLPIAAGRWTAIVGPNGAGKSSLLRVLAGLWLSQSSAILQGQVMLGEHELGQLSAQQRARRIAWLGQSEQAALDLQVQDVVMLGRLPHMGWLGTAQVTDHEAAHQAMQTTQTLELRDRLLGQLSVGERQRVLIARVLACQAPIVLMDEPLAHLDAPHQADWLALVRELTGRGVTVVSVLHELPIALQADALVVMKAGRVTHHGQTNDQACRAVEAVFDQRFEIKSTEWGPMLRYLNA